MRVCVLAVLVLVCLAVDCTKRNAPATLKQSENEREEQVHEPHDQRPRYSRAFRLSASMVPRQFFEPHLHMYSSLFFLLCGSSSTNQ